MAELNNNVNKIGELDKRWEAKPVTIQVRIDIAEKKITANSLTANHACEDVNLLRIKNSKPQGALHN